MQEQYTKTVESLSRYLRVDLSYDVLARPFKIGSRNATLFFVEGFAKDEILEKLLEYVMSLKDEDLANIRTASAFEQKYITYIETGSDDDIRAIATQVLSGLEALVIEGVRDVVMIEARAFPTRSVDEPDTDRVMRGSHDGFVETLVFNTALLHRRIRVGVAQQKGFERPDALAFPDNGFNGIRRGQGAFDPPLAGIDLYVQAAHMLQKIFNLGRRVEESHAQSADQFAVLVKKRNAVDDQRRAAVGEAPYLTQLGLA